MTRDDDEEVTRALAAAYELDGLDRERFLDGLAPSLAKEVRGLLRNEDSDRQLIDHLFSAMTDPIEENPPPGSRIGHYQVIRWMPGGGMSRVAEAEDLELPRKVALKAARGPWGAYGLREARIIARLSHPNIVTVYGVFQHEGINWIAEEFVEPGRTLADLLETLRKEGRYPVREARRMLGIILRVADALGHAHSNRVVHRDVKPSNILLDSRGIPKVADFGIALQVGQDIAQRGTTGRTGTLEYMSPEQLRGDHLDARTDIWSLGVCLYEVLHLRLPFTGVDSEARLRCIDEVDLSQVPEGCRRHARALRRVYRRALEKDREQRYGSMEEFARDLGRSLKLRARRLAAAVVSLVILVTVGVIWLLRPGPVRDIEYRRLIGWPATTGMVELWEGLEKDTLAWNLLWALSVIRGEYEQQDRMEALGDGLKGAVEGVGPKETPLVEDAAWLRHYLGQRAGRGDAGGWNAAGEGEEYLLKHDAMGPDDPLEIRFNARHPVARLAAAIAAVPDFHKGLAISDFDSAMAELEEVTAGDVGGATALLVQSRLQLAEGRSTGDVGYLIGGLRNLEGLEAELEGQKPQLVLISLGQVHFLLHNDDLAVRYLEEAKGARKNKRIEQNLYCTLGLLLARQGRWTECWSALDEAGKRLENDVYVRLAVAEARLHYGREKPKEAYDSAKRAAVRTTRTGEEMRDFVPGIVMCARIKAVEGRWGKLEEDGRPEAQTVWWHLVEAVEAGDRHPYPSSMAMACVLAAARPDRPVSRTWGRDVEDLCERVKRGYRDVRGEKPWIVWTAEGASELVLENWPRARVCLQEAVRLREKARDELRREGIVVKGGASWGRAEDVMDYYMLAIADGRLKENGAAARVWLDKGDEVLVELMRGDGWVEYRDIMEALRKRAE